MRVVTCIGYLGSIRDSCDRINASGQRDLETRHWVAWQVYRLWRNGYVKPETKLQDYLANLCRDSIEYTSRPEYLKPLNSNLFGDLV